MSKYYDNERNHDCECRKDDYKKDDCRKDNCKKVDCKEVLKKYHCLIDEANKLFMCADSIVEKEVVKEICDALKAIAKAFEIDETADEIWNKADMLLDKTGCDKKFGKKICKCEGFVCKYEEAYEKENAYLCEAEKLLREALEAVKLSIKFRNKGDKAYYEYVDCIHEKEEKKDCDCPNPIERYMK